MKWILIYSIFTLYGLTTGNVEFKNKQRCQNAQEAIQDLADVRGEQIITAICVKK